MSMYHDASRTPRISRRHLAALGGAGVLSVVGLRGSSLRTTAQSATPTPSDAIQEIVDGFMTDMDLRAVLVHAQRGDDVVASFAVGESMTGVTATPHMHVRNGAVAISLVSMLTLMLVDEGTFGLDDPIDQWLPEVPDSDQVTIRMLLNMTAGYRDYVQNVDFVDAQQDDPFRSFTPDELIAYGLAQPRIFAPGANWEYSHTDYVILGRVIERAAGGSVEHLMQEKVLDPLGLNHTQNSRTAEIPEPVLHAFTSERREWLGIPEGRRFYEESTYWNPSWTITEGAVQTSTVADMAASMAAVGRGTLLSPASHEALLSRDLLGFGEPLDGCASCHTMTEDAVYGLGVWLIGPWLVQNPLFSGYSGTAGYSADHDLSIAVAVTDGEASFGPDGSYAHGNASTPIFQAIGALLSGT